MAAYMNARSRIVSIGLCSVATLTCATSVSSAQSINRSFVDWKQYLPAGWQAAVDISTYIDDPDLIFLLQDNAIIAPGDGDIGREFYGAGIAFFTSGTNGVASDLMQITTVYGIDLTPQEDIPMVNGVNPGLPEYQFVSHETLIGISGTEYTSGPVEAIPLGSIASILPGHDMSWFAQGDPNTLLYYFTTYGPKEEFYRVPAPGVLCLLGISGLLASRRRST